MRPVLAVGSDGCLAAHTAEAIQAAVARTLEGRRSDTLLRRAAAALAGVCVDVLRDRRGAVYGSRVVLLVGTGHNGADALLAGALLRRRGVTVDAVLVGDKAYQPGVDTVRAAGGSLVDATTIAGRERALQALAVADLMVDGIIGDQGVGGLRGVAADLVAAMPDGPAVVAVDLPSGVDPDSGEIHGAHVRADVTVTFGTFKGCLMIAPACYAAGRIEFVDVGFADQLDAEPLALRLTPGGIAELWPVPAETDHKYSRGVLGVVAGSDTYPGAAVLACLGAVRAGVGIVRYVGPRRVADHVLSATPEIVPGPARVQAWLLGSGVEDDADQERAIDTALASGLPCVVDAGALEVCARRRAAGDRPAPSTRILLTPHAGEAARIFAALGHDVARTAIEDRPLHHVTWLAREVDATVLLKGSTTLVANPEGPVFSQNDGPVWLATAGSGDVLAGIAGALMAAGLDAVHAGAMAASVHGLAAAKASAGGPASAAVTTTAIAPTVADLLRLRPGARRGRVSRSRWPGSR
ncbi:NAD(P)H-hydrate dehydratase [Microlunatus parietis]|nr:NAD(P)H-hydrate dehydratase [Microlunatus parietis]